MIEGKQEETSHIAPENLLKTTLNESGLYLMLGDYGLKILRALSHGWADIDAISFMSGVPRACVTGRLPVLQELELVEARDGAYRLKKEPGA